MMLEAEVEKRIMYIPVAEATEGKTPRLNRIGLKMAPPPRPRAPDMKPPMKAKTTSLKITEELNLRSLGAKPTPSLFLSDYSLRLLLIAITVSKAQYPRYVENIIQSP